MNYFFEVLKKYAVFEGRARRKEYWYFLLFSYLVFAILSFLEGFLGLFPNSEDAVLANIYYVLVLIPSIAVAIRRVHDVNKSGWFVLIPIYNLILFCTDGTKGPNKYGPDPKNTMIQESKKKFCTQCGAPSEIEIKFCSKCGSAF